MATQMNTYKLSNLIYADYYSFDLENDNSDILNRLNGIDEALAKVAGALVKRGEKSTIFALPQTGNNIGDFWNVTEDDSNWAWNGNSWYKLSKDSIQRHYFNKLKIKKAEVNALVTYPWRTVGQEMSSDLPAEGTTLQIEAHKGLGITHNAIYSNINGRIDTVSLKVDENTVMMLDGDQVINGAKSFAQGPYGTTVDLGNSSTIDLSTGVVFKKTISANTTFTITGVSAGKAATFNLVLVNGGFKSITWPFSVKWVDDTPPELSENSTDILTFMTPDGGTNWYGTVAVSNTNGTIVVNDAQNGTP